jgi:hypothetical protein
MGVRVGTQVKGGVRVGPQEMEGHCMGVSGAVLQENLHKSRPVLDYGDKWKLSLETCFQKSN